VQFVSRAPGLALYLTAGDATLVLVNRHAHGHCHPLSHGSALLATAGLSATVPISAAAIRLHYVGANAAAQAIGQDQLPGVANYLVGSDPAGWRTGLPTYAQVSYQDVYPGVDLVYYGNQAQLEYDWRVAPGADPHAIAFQVQGARRLRVDGDGNLVVSTDVGALVQRPPTVYQQDADGSRHAVAARYTLSATGAQSATVGFDVGAYDTGKPLVIDPVLSYSTYLGGNDGDQGTAIAVDRTGAAYLTGDTYSTNFPTTPGVIQRTGTNGGSNDDAFVTKLNPSGTALVYSTYLGGATGGDLGYGIAVDRAGDAYVAGRTSSTDFPTTPGAFQRTNLGAPNLYDAAFVSKLNPMGSALLYSTYLTAATGDVDAHGLAIDGAGDAYVTSSTSATDFPTTPGAPQTHSGGGSCTGGCSDAFVTKLTATGSALAYSTYLGGSNNDVGQGVAVDRAGNTYVTGYTLSTNFPTVNPEQGASGGNTSGGTGDAFVPKIGANRLPPTILPGGSGAVAWHPHQGGGGSIGGGVGLSVDLADGHVDVSVPGLSLPGRGPNLAFTRSWDSALAQTGADGTGWQSSLTPGISGDLTGVVYYADESGATWPFTYTGSAADPGPYTAYQTTPGKPWQLATSTAGYTLTNFLTSETMTFDGQGRLLADSDAYGNPNTMTYGSNGVTSEANSGGRALSFSYSNGQLGDAMSPLWQSSGGAQGQHVHYGYNGSGQLTTSTLGAGTSDAVTTTFGYSGTQLTNITLGSGHTWTMGYDAQGRVASLTSPVSGTVGQRGYTAAYTTQYTYAPGQTQVVEGAGMTAALTTTYTLDPQGQVTTMADGLNHSTSAAYDADHDIVSSTDANGNVTTNAYSYVGPNGSTGLVTQTVQPRIQAYSPLNMSMDPVVTTHTYDPATHDLIQTTKPEGGIERYGYDGHHALMATTVLLNAGASTWRGSITTYDPYGESITTVDGRGVSVDGTGNATLNSSAALYTRRLGYDAQGNQTSAATAPITTTLPSGTIQVGVPVTTTYGYDADGNQTLVLAANGNGNMTTSTYNHLGRLVQAGDSSVTLYSAVVVTPTQVLSYDGDGNLVRQVDGNGNVRTSSYDPLQRLVVRTDAVSGTTVITYSATERVAAQDARGNVSTYGYDGAGRVIQQSDAVSGTAQYQYDAAGNTTVITSSDRTTATPIQVETRGYDALNRAITDTVTGPVGPALTTITRYDHDGNLYQTQQPNGDVTLNTYDLAGQLLTEEIDPAAVTGPTHATQQTFTYDAAGNRVGSYDFAGRSQTTTYDGEGRTVQSVGITTPPTGTTTITTMLSFDPDGNPVRRVTQTQDGTGQPKPIPSRAHTTRTTGPRPSRTMDW